jgi:hypothetical protein
LEGADPLTCLVPQRRPVAFLHDDERLVVHGEVGVPLDEGAQRLLGRGGRRDALPADAEELLADLDEHLLQQRVLGGEVLVQGRPRDAARCAELGDGDAVEPLLGEERRGGVHQLCPPGAHACRILVKPVNVR